MFTILCNIPIQRYAHTHFTLTFAYTTHARAKNGANFHRARRSHARGGSGASPSARLVRSIFSSMKICELPPVTLVPVHTGLLPHTTARTQEKSVAFASFRTARDSICRSSLRPQRHRTQLEHTHWTEVEVPPGAAPQIHSSRIPSTYRTCGLDDGRAPSGRRTHRAVMRIALQRSRSSWPARQTPPRQPPARRAAPASIS